MVDSYDPNNPNLPDLGDYGIPQAAYQSNPSDNLLRFGLATLAAGGKSGATLGGAIGEGGLNAMDYGRSVAMQRAQMLDLQQQAQGRAINNATAAYNLRLMQQPIPDPYGGGQACRDYVRRALAAGVLTTAELKAGPHRNARIVGHAPETALRVQPASDGGLRKPRDHGRPATTRALVGGAGSPSRVPKEGSEELRAYGESSMGPVPCPL